MSKKVRRWELKVNEFWETELVLDPKGNYVLMEDYVALERRHQDLLDAIERTGGLDNIRRVEVSPTVVIDMARENAFMKGIIMRMTEAGDALVELLKNEEYATEPDEDGEYLDEVRAWNAAKEGKQP